LCRQPRFLELKLQFLESLLLLDRLNAHEWELLQAIRSAPIFFLGSLKVVSSEKVGGSGVTLTPGTLYGGVVMGVLFSFDEAAILYRDFNSVPP
jgi:hypothetical protein